MCMAFPFLMLKDIDEVWEEMKVNGQVISSKSNVYKILDVVQKQEALTPVTLKELI